MPLVAKEDLMLHKVIGEGVMPDGTPVELTEGLPLRAGDPVPVEELAAYQQDDLKNPESNLAKLVADLSDDQYREVQALKNPAVVSSSNEEFQQEGEVTVTKTSVNATPGALTYAEAKGIDLSNVPGTGQDGRITKGDVEAYEQLQGGDS
jgi:pyruvate dehydrogenase E2 component (dihydrolipoyllysine-residue acetyltransferase)